MLPLRRYISVLREDRDAVLGLLFAVFVVSVFVALEAHRFHKRGVFGITEYVYAVAETVCVLLFFMAIVAILWENLTSAHEWVTAQRAKKQAWIPLLGFIILCSAFFWFVQVLAQGFAFEVWSLSPLGLSYSDTSDTYDDACTVMVQDDENSGHREHDWHSGESVCLPLSRELWNEYPKPSWLFGRPPSYKPED